MKLRCLLCLGPKHDLGMGNLPQEIDEAMEGLKLEGEGVRRSFYHPLQDVDEIRLLHLHPGSSREEIKCTIVHGTLSKQPSYEALSYMWGPKDIVQTVTINGISFNVRENLWSALQHLRLASKIRVLWIDAICIHQRNIHERNYQVSQMGRIYNRATRVVVWLGPSDTASKLFFDLLSRQWTTYLTLPSDPALAIERNRELEAIYSILSRTYWKRLWIIQEFLMAREFTIQCGNDSCTSSWICWFIGQISTAEASPPSLKLRENVTILRSLEKSMPVRLLRRRLGFVNFGDVKSRREVTLFELFSEYNDAECEDQRDKIFGLYSLAPTCCREANTINYSLAWKEVLGRLVSHQLDFHNSLMESLPTSGDQDFVVAYIQDFYMNVKPFSSSSGTDGTIKAKPGLEALEKFTQFMMRRAKRWPPKGASAPGFAGITGYARGRVCYISPPLSQDYSQDYPPLPELTSMLRLQIEYICSLAGDSEACHPHATTETDLVNTVSGLERLPLEVEPTTDYPFRNYTKNPIQYWGNNGTTETRVKLNLTHNFYKLLSAGRHCPGSTHVLAFEENGLIFFASKETKIGDIVFQFPGSDILAVVQSHFHYDPNSSGDYRIAMSRAVNFLASPSTVAADICGKPMSFDRVKREGLHGVSFAAWPGPMERLCRMSDRPNGQHNMLNMAGS